MRALITNDDGVGSQGIRTLTDAAVAAGLDVIVAAPHQERSGSSAALSALEEDGRLLVDRVGVGGLDALAVHASPAMVVFVAVRGAFGPVPDIVLSGVNHGPNTGQAVLHSGTVGAAFTAASHGVPALAISMAGEVPTHWPTARVVSDLALSWFVDDVEQRADATDHPFLLNVNVPDVPPEQLRGMKEADLAGFGAVQAEIGERGEGYVTMTFAQIDAEADPGTDVAFLSEGWATATALRPPIAASSIDLSSLQTELPARTG
jgi:5'-nucleotidase